MADKQALGARADQFAGHNSNQAHDMLAAVTLFLSRSKKGRSPKWRQCTPEPAAASATPFSLFEYKRMPFSLRTAGPSFQQHVDRTIRDCHAAFACVNNIVVCSRNHEEHVVLAQQVQQALQDNSLVIYAGGGGSWPQDFGSPSHVAAIQELPHPTIIKEL
jgi:hypothetical protein